MSDLKNPKVGDLVCLVHRGGWNARIHKIERGAIERVTKTQVTAFGRRWLISSGREVGENFGRFSTRPFLQPLTAEIEQEAESDALEAEVLKVCFAASDVLSKARGKNAVALKKLAEQVLEASHDQ